ncbi:MAG: hypothetical protein JO297_06880 [Nitrososphaeraceae archaeon]|nr:hypothetical protein [Nitrososphaeraceae archaeon]
MDKALLSFGIVILTGGISHTSCGVYKHRTKVKEIFPFSMVVGTSYFAGFLAYYA